MFKETKLNIFFAIVCVCVCVFVILCNINIDDKVDVIYSTDLWADGDFDDYLDLAVMYSLKNINMHLILDNATDNGIQETELGGCPSVNNLNYIYNKNIMPMLGKKNPYSTYSIEHITSNLAELLDEIDNGIIITVGSLRDIAALYNTSPDIVQKKIDKLFVFAGDFENTYDEYNVQLDREAYDMIMNSDLPIYWIPCFQNGLWTTGDHCSFFQTEHSDILSNCNDNLLKWFVYEYYDSSEEFDQFELAGEEEEFLKLRRNLWCAPILPFITGEYDEDSMLKEYEHSSGEKIEFPWYFTDYSYNCKMLKLFTIRNYDDYIKFNKWILNKIYSKT